MVKGMNKERVELMFEEVTDLFEELYDKLAEDMNSIMIRYSDDKDCQRILGEKIAEIKLKAMSQIEATNNEFRKSNK